jgi:hypothetical protein
LSPRAVTAALEEHLPEFLSVFIFRN